MKLKNLFSVLIFIMVLICCVNAINAASDDNILELNQNEDIISTNDEVELSITDTNALSEVQQESTLKESTDTSKEGADTSTSDNLSPAEKFSSDLKNGEKTVYLTGDIKIKEPFVIKNKVVIDGQGHSIDGQHKTNIFKVIQSSLTIKNLVLKNGLAEKGGAIYSYKSNLNIDKCTFLNNKATDKAGAIFITNANLIIKNSHFEKNIVENSKSNGYAGAIWVIDGTSQISKTIFKNNYCKSKSLKSHKKATKYQFGGGAIYLNKGSSHTITECTFTGNQASNDGGAIYALKCKSVKIDKCTFKNNKACFEDGGCIIFNGKKLVISNSEFYNNRAYEDGGVMDSFSLTKQKTHITITGCTFKGNTAYKGGGVFWIGVKTVYTMKNNKFINNKASIGGVFYNEDGNVKITNCLFQSNKAKKVTSWTVKTKAGGKLSHCGGAIMIEKKSVTISKSVFKKNSASYGGAIYYLNGKLKLKGNTFSSNKAKSVANEIFASKKLKVSNNNKWGSKKISTKKAVKNKKMFSNVAA